MSTRQTIRIVAGTPASPHVVYRLLADGPSWGAWSPMDECVPDGLAPNGAEQVGTVRMGRRGRTRGWDEVTELIPDRRLGYRHLRGLPVRDYVAGVTLDRLPEGGTSILWTAEFNPRWPGTGGLLLRNIRRFLGECTRGLATYAGEPG